MIESAGEGVVVYLRQEGRGIGLINKLKAYSLQDGGLDTVEANERLGFAADLRNYGVGAQILSDLGVRRLRLITNNPRKIAGLGGYGLQVVDRVPLVMDPGLHNAAYLRVKRTKLGHLMDAESHGLTAVLGWHGPEDPLLGASRIEVLREWARRKGLMLEREEDPRLLALLHRPGLALLLAAQQGRQLTAADLAGPLMEMARWPGTSGVSLLLAPDGRRKGHPSIDLEPERRQLGDLVPLSSVSPPSDGDDPVKGSGADAVHNLTCPLLNLTPGAFIVWT
jgi:3,4-dihydroxy 2-butanone 4-phosphate synthase/GTP cyclohydrolase II